MKTLPSAAFACSTATSHKLFSLKVNKLLFEIKFWENATAIQQYYSIFLYFFSDAYIKLIFSNITVQETTHPNDFF